MLRSYLHARPFATKTPSGSGRRKAVAAAKTKATAPSLRRNTKRIHEAMAQTAIHSVAQSLAQTTPLRVLGLDINTNSTGYAVLDGRGRVHQWGHISTAHVASADILAIAHVISDALRDVYAPSSTDVQWAVGIEDFMRMYRFGQFHNKGIFQLAQLNGIVSYTCWQRFGCRPVHTHPTAARALFGVGQNKKTANAATVKEQVLAFVLAQEPASAATQLLRTDHVNRFGQWTDAAYDIADAYVVAAYTRWMALQSQLQRDPALLRQFSDAYLARTLPMSPPAATADANELTTKVQKTKTTKKPTTVEAAALKTMDAAARDAYLGELFASGVSDWVKQHQVDGDA